MNTAIAALLGGLLVGGVVMVGIGIAPIHQLSTGQSTSLWTRVDNWFSRLPRRSRVHGLTGLGIGVVGYVVTGWAVLLVIVPVLAVVVPALLADPPRHDLDVMRALERWVRLVSGSASTGKSVIDAIRATRRQAPELLIEPLTRVVARLPRRSRVHGLTGLGIGVVGYVVTGWAVLLVIVPVLAVVVPALLADPPRHDLDVMRALERWVRLVSGSASTGKSVIDAIRATRRQAPEPLIEPLTRVVARLDSRWDTRSALQGLADDLDSADADQVIAAIMMATERGGTGATGTLDALAASLQERIRAAREIRVERAKPRVVVRQVSIIIGVVLAGALILGREYLVPYRTGVGQLLLCCYAGLYLAGLIALSRRSKPRRRARILLRRAGEANYG